MRLAVSIVALFLIVNYSLFGETIPGRFIVELDAAPMGALARARVGGSTAVMLRSAIAASQNTVASLVERRGGRVVSSLKNAVNAIVVELPEDQAAHLAFIPGVKKVYPASRMTARLDHALPLHKIPEAWARIGGLEKAGLGVKVAILDTGIASKHPAFEDPTLPMPAGYPIVSGPQNSALIGNKIIVARDYGALYKVTGESAEDRYGHGTQVADCAVGMPVAGPYATVTGAAPKAYLGVYKITTGNGGDADDSVIAQAIDDAVGDGMDVINLSFGGDASLFDSITIRMTDLASELGVLVVVAAGNGGGAGSIADPADGANLISVGATQNDRYFGGRVDLPGLPSIAANQGSYRAVNASLRGALNDMLPWAAQLGCAPLPAGSLSGQIGLLTPGDCIYETMLKNLKAAGAVGAIFYPGFAALAAPGGFSPLSADLPAVIVSYSDGQILKAAAANFPIASITPEGIGYPQQNLIVARFSSRGPTDASGLKPDLLATGTNIYAATQTIDRQGANYRADGFRSGNGTSYSAPIVAGAGAVLRSARPGLTVNQYRSLLINSAAPISRNFIVGSFLTNKLPPSLPGMQTQGSGVLNLEAAMTSTVTAYPTSLSFGSGIGDIQGVLVLTVTNVGKALETYTISTIPFDGTATPTFVADGAGFFGGTGAKSIDVTLRAGQSRVVQAVWIATGPAPGSEQQGMVLIRGHQTGSTATVPYWHGTPDFIPDTLSSSGVSTPFAAGTTQNYYFKVRDQIGTGITDNSILRARGIVTLGKGKIEGPFVSTVYRNNMYFAITTDPTPGPNGYIMQIAGYGVSLNITGTAPSADLGADAGKAIFEITVPQPLRKPVR